MKIRRLKPRVAAKLFGAYLKGRGLAETTVSCRLQMLGKFFRFLKEASGEEGVDLRSFSFARMQAYLKYLEEATYCRGRRENGERVPLASGTKGLYVLSVKELFRCLYRQQYILTNPLAEFSYKRKEEESRRAVLSQEEMARLLDGIEISTPTGVRDRALFELMYATGLRIREVLKLTLRDIDLTERLLFVHGKGGRTRLQPVSEAGCRFLALYLKGKDVNQEPFRPLFRGTARGGCLSVSSVREHFKKWAEQAGVMRKNLSLHSIRHSVGTHLLENGANIRYVQAFLGHEQIETTVRYTRPTEEKLKRIYKSYHPTENQYYRELDASYLKRLEDLKQALKRAAKALSEKKRCYQKLYNMQRRKKKN